MCSGGGGARSGGYDDATIRKVDDKWKDLGMGPFIASPSRG